MQVEDTILHGGTTYVLDRTCRKDVSQIVADLVLKTEWNVDTVSMKKLVLRGVEANHECWGEVDFGNSKSCGSISKARTQVLR